MGLDVKEMQVSIREFLELSRSFVKKYPVVSESAIGEKRNVGISARKPTSAQDDLVENERENSSIRPQSVRRRNAKEKDKRVFVREGVEEKDMVFSAISDDDLIDKAALIEENPKEIREVNVASVIDRAESSSAASQRLRHECGDASGGRTNKFDYGGSELDAESSDDGEDEDEEEEAQEDGNKAVEWTEDDQKNLMDLGFSEMERNKRLESLIARRKARKMLSMQVRRTLMNTGSTDPCGQIASVLIPRSNPFPTNVSGGPQVSPTPGSAPSVLLPIHNPFDLPYEPQEEKPNLSGGSFQEEFIGTSQKDLMFCRHESFSLGAFFPGPGEFDQSRRGTFYCPNFATRPMAPEIPEYSRFKNQSGKEHPSTKLTQTESSLECKPMLHVNSSQDDAIQQVRASERVCNIVNVPDEEDRNEVHRVSNLVRDDVTGGSSSSSSSEVNVPFSAANKEEILKSLSFSVPKNIAVDVEYNGRRNGPLCDGSPSSFRNKIQEERFFFPDKVVSHTPTHSIASDMQVEVSEFGSTELSVDGTISPSDVGSLSYEADLDGGKEVNSGSEETWVASSQLSRVEENESRSSEVHEVSEQDIIEVGFSGMNQKTEDTIASDMVPEKVVEEDSVDASVSFPNIELAERSQSHMINFDGDVHDEVRLPSTSCASDALSTENLASLTLENALQSSKKSEAHPSCEKVSGETEERSDSPKISAQELNTDCDASDEVVFAYDDTEILEFIKNTYGEAPVLIKRETTEGPSTVTMENDEKPLEIIEGYSGDPEHDYSNPTEFFEGEYGQQSSLTSNSIGNENIQDRRGEPVVIDVGSSGPIHNSNDTIASTMQPEIVAEQGPSDSSSSSSSSSVTQEKFPISEVSQLNFDQTTRIKVQEIASEVVDDNFADGSLPESSDLAASLNALHLKERLVTCLSDDRDPEKPQQGEYQTFLESESHKPAEESVSMNSSEDFESLLEKLGEHKDMASTSRPIGKMDRGESTQARECDESALDIGHFGFRQISNDTTPLTMLPELVVEQVPTASSSSSPKSDIHKMVSVELVSSSSIDPEMHLKVQKSDEENAEINLLDKLLPENLDSPAPQNAHHLSSDSTAYSSFDKDFEEIQEPSNPPINVTQELNSIHSVKVPEVIANNDMRNFKTIDEINNEAHIFASEGNAGVLSNMSNESISKRIDVAFIEGQNVIGYEGENVNVAECENIAGTSIPVDNNRTLETSQEHGQEIVEVEISEVSPSTGLIVPVMLIGTAESGLSQIHQSFISDTNPPDLLPEGVVEQVPVTSSSSSSPNSVLQTKFSIDQGSALSLEYLDQETQVEAQQSEIEMDENALINGLRPENLTAAVPQNSLYLMVDSRAHLSDNNYSGGLQEPSNSPRKPAKEDSFNSVSHSESDEKEEKPNSTSIEDGEAQPQLFNQDALIDPTELSDVTSVECPGGVLKQMSENGVVIGMSKPIRQNENSGTAERTEEFGEAMKSKNDRDSSKLTVNNDNLEATEVEGKDTNANVVGLSKPVEDDDDSSISEEREVMSENGVVIGTSKPIRQNENSGTAERTEEFGEAMKSKNDRDSSKLTVNNDNLEATEVVEGKDTNANVVGLSKPVEDGDDSSISEEREEPTKVDPGKRSFEEANIISKENELVANVMVAEEDLRSSVGETEGESLRAMRSEDVAQQPKNVEVADSSTTESDEGKSDKQTEPEAMVGFSQPAAKKDNLDDTKDTEEIRNLADNEDVQGRSKSDLSNGGLDQSGCSKGETKEVIRHDI
ncbi:uncharacterized protein LOC131314345 isoform X4 [Rhododendron vialii]|uniref:uncharacterized protein LOC131314345 isoform X4 n=1 Tax=Rhododendron vialii TaxID=182163 RepID=UPI00265DA7DC|nr:uncharacterized protein LOC131314345 isoform X4 [Rhododendron vialii]